MKSLSLLPFLIVAVASIPQDLPTSGIPGDGQPFTSQFDVGPGASPTVGPPLTLEIGIPSQGSTGFTSTVPACGTVPPIISRCPPNCVVAVYQPPNYTMKQLSIIPSKQAIEWRDSLLHSFLLSTSRPIRSLEI